MRCRQLWQIFIVSVFAFVFAACGGGSSSTTPGTEVSALKVPERISVVDPSSQNSTTSYSPSPIRPLTIGVTQIDPSSFPPDSDYNKDETFVFVGEMSLEAFDIVNEILCMMAQTKYDEMLNKGPYKAQVDRKLCSSTRDDAQSAAQSSINQSSGASAPDYELWVVDSSRADNNSPQIVKAWVHEKGDGFEPPKLIKAKVVITEGKSDSNPLGIFNMDFAAYPVVNGQVDTNTIIFKGFMRTEKDPATGKILLKFITDGGINQDQFSQKVTLQKDNSGSSGSGTIETVESFQGNTNTTHFDIAYDDNFFLRSDGTNQVCLDRNNFDETAWRYGLYDSSGSRVVRNSGFPIKIDKNGTSYHGWVGYYGLWFPDEVTVQNGDTVYREEFGPGRGNSTPYTLVVSGGKLKKHTKKVLTLGEVKNVPLQLHEFDSQSGQDVEYKVVWDGTQFTKVAVLDMNNWTWTSLNPPVVMDLSSVEMTELNFWSEALGGSVQVKLDNCQDNYNGTFSCQASDASQVITFIEELVYPGDNVPSQLYCFENCPDVTLLSSGNEFPYQNYGYQNVPPASAQKAIYTFDGTQMVLKDDSGNPVVTTNSAYEFGIWSGPLIDQNDVSALACDWDSNSTCPWKAWSNLDVFYTWETGPNDWNHFTGIKDSNGQFVKFDPPLLVEYVHNWDQNTSSKFLLEYNGFGDLGGIPGKCVDVNTGQDVDCGQGGPSVKWVPEFSIPAGAVVTAYLPDGSTAEYVVKPLEKEQMMKEDASGNGCSGFNLTSYQLPDISDWTDPGIGDEPTVDAPPAVIGGIVQNQS